MSNEVAVHEFIPWSVATRTGDKDWVAYPQGVEVMTMNGIDGKVIVCVRKAE